MRRLRYRTALGLLVVLLALPATSSAATYETHGWWWRAQTGLLGAELPPPPDVPEDGLLVERGPDGATAVAAVRFGLSEGETDPVLELTVASGESTGAVIAACPTRRAGWPGEQAGRWDAAPGWDCEAGRVDGVPSDDGSTWSWALAPLVGEGGVISVALVDGTSNTFHLAFEAPTDTSLRTTTAPPPPGPPPSSPPPPPAESTSASSSSGAFQPPHASSSGAPGSTPFAIEEGPGAPVPSEPPPEVAPPAQPATSAVPVAISPPGAPQTEGLPPLAFVLMGAIGTLIVTDVAERGLPRGGGPPWRAPRQGTGGIGRFAAQRTQRPSSLW